MSNPTLQEVLQALKVVRGKTNPTGLILQLGRMVQQLPEHSACSPADREHLADILAVLRCLRRYNSTAEGLLTVELIAFGKAGRFSAAVRKAQQAHRDGPTWTTAVMAGNALRRAGKLVAASKMFATAADFDPKDVTALLEVGDIALEAGKLSAALRAYEQALIREPEHAWAEPSAWYCRYAMTGDAACLTNLRKAAELVEACECGVGAMLDELVGGYSDEQRQQRAAYLLSKIEEK